MESHNKANLKQKYTEEAQKLIEEVLNEMEELQRNNIEELKEEVETLEKQNKDKDAKIEKL